MTSTAEAESIRRQAAEWLVRSEKPDFSPDERARFEAWMAQHPRHRVEFYRAQYSWNRFDRLRAIRPLDPEAPVDPDILEKFARSGLMPVEPHRSWAFEFPQWAAAAMLVFLCVAAVLVLGVTINNVMWDTYETSIGGREHVPLPDGSVVQLNTDTRLRVRFTDGARQLELLRGEALFTVASDPNRPFTVAAGNTVVRAVGTTFSIRLRSDNEVDVLLTEGRASVTAWKAQRVPGVPRTEASSLLLSAQHLAEVRGKAIRARQLTPAEIRRREAWLEGLIIVEHDALTDVVAEFNRYNRRKLVVADTAIASRRLGGTFDVTDLDSFVRALENGSDIRSEWDMGMKPTPDDDVILLKRAGEEMPVP